MKLNLRIHIVMAILFTLLLGVGGKVGLCLTPHGVHVQPNYVSNHASCALTKQHPAPTGGCSLEHHREKCQSHCHNIALEGDKADFAGKYSIEMPAPALMPLAMSSPPTPIKKFPPLLAVQLPQLALRQSVILLI